MPDIPELTLNRTEAINQVLEAINKGRTGSVEKGRANIRKLVIKVSDSYAIRDGDGIRFNQETGLGTGVILDPANGWILTAAHCVTEHLETDLMRPAIERIKASPKEEGKLFGRVELMARAYGAAHLFYAPEEGHATSIPLPLDPRLNFHLEDLDVAIVRTLIPLEPFLVQGTGTAGFDQRILRTADQIGMITRNPSQPEQLIEAEGRVRQVSTQARGHLLLADRIKTTLSVKPGMSGSPFVCEGAVVGVLTYASTGKMPRGAGIDIRTIVEYLQR